MGSRTRLLAAMTLIVMPVATGLHATPSFAAEAVQAKGACWAYTPNGTDLDAEASPIIDWLTAPVQSDGIDGTVATAPVAWSPDPDGAELLLSTSGATAKDSQRSVTLTLEDGPVLDALSARKGTAYAVLRVLAPGADPAAPAVAEDLRIASSEFDLEAGEAASGLTFTGTDVLDLVEEGEYRVVLDSVHFVVVEELVPGTTSRLHWVCNAQTGTEPSVVGAAPAPGGAPATEPVLALNPAETPEPFVGVESSFAVQSTSLLVLHDVRGQVSTGAARPGDRLVLSASGMNSATEYQVGFGPAGGPYVTADVTVLSDDAGEVAQFEVVVPDDAPVGPGTVSLVTVATPEVPSAPAGVPLTLQVLGVPTLTVQETVGDESLDLVVAGVGFDPTTEVRVRARAGDDSAKDKVVTLWTDAQGAFSTDYVVTDEDATAVRALQRREGNRAELAARHELVNGVPVPKADPPPTETPQPSSPPVATTPPSVQVPSVPQVAPPVAPPVDIPILPEAPFEEITAPPVPEVVTAAELVISEPTLEGSPSMGELFGGASNRRILFEVENAGDGVASDPQVQVGIGRTTDAVPSEAATSLGDMEPGARVAVGINLELPMASFGTYQVVGQVVDQAGDTPPTAFSVRWDTYPWGLFAVNAAGLGLLVWGVQRRRTKAAPLPAGPESTEVGASVVDLDALDKWWKEGRVVHTAPVVAEDNDSVVDLDAADRWWSRNQGNVS